MIDRWIEWICPISMAIAFFAAVPWGRKPWWLVDASANFTFGIGLIFLPQYVMGFQVTDNLDEVHLYLCRLIGSLMVGSALSWFLSRNSVDSRMFGCQFFSRVISCTFLLIAQLYSAYHLWKRPGLRFNDKFLLFASSGVACWLLGTLFQLLRYKEYGGYIYRMNWLHVGLLLDHYVLLVLAVVDFAFPSQLLRFLITKTYKIDGVHVCLLRTAAALLFGLASSSNASKGFLYTGDKRAHILGRLLAQTLIFCVNIFSHFYLNLFSMYHVTPFMLSGFYITFLLSLFFRVKKEKEN